MFEMRYRIVEKVSGVIVGDSKTNSATTALSVARGALGEGSEVFVVIGARWVPGAEFVTQAEAIA